MRFLFLVFLLSLNVRAAPPSSSCGPGQHWVSAYHRRAYTRGDGTPVRETDVKAHCQGNPASYREWNSKLMEGKPSSWWHQKEESNPWSTEERERVLEALAETPELLKDPNIHGIYRMGFSDSPNNPASNNYSDFVLYNEAFGKNFVLTHVLDHELAHRLFDNLSESERNGFRKAGKWKPNEQKKGSFEAGRPEGEVVRKNDMLSPAEDFADSITSYTHQPTRLKKLSPAVYDWMKEHFGSKLKVRGSK